MGLAEYLSNARLAYHGYTPEVIEQTRGYLAQKRQEQQWRAYEERRRLELAEEAGKRAADSAEAQRKADERSQQQERYKSIYEQLKLLPEGADPSRLVGVEDVPVGDLRTLQERVKAERTYARELAEAERARKETERAEEAARDEARNIRLHRRYKEIDQEFTTPKTPDEGVDPFFRLAQDELREMQRSGIIPPELKTTTTIKVLGKDVPTDTLDRAKIDEWARARADALRQIGRRNISTALSPSEQARLAKMSPEDQAEAAQILAGGNITLITKLRARLGSVR